MIVQRSSLFVLPLILLAIATASADEPIHGNGANPQAVAEVAAGKISTANASWWGFNADDATDKLQQAVDSKAKALVVPYIGKPWILRPVKLRGDLELIFEPGVVVLAKAGEFKGRGDSLFAVYDSANVTIRGYGSLFRMRKKDYQNPPYDKAEWRMGVRVMGCQHVRIEGLTIESSGGDGIYVGSSKKNRWCDDVVVRDCVCHDNHRQGMSVTSAQNLLVENCTFSQTGGTAPEAGIDFEPDTPDERIANCVVRNCRFVDNAGHAILVYLNPLTSKSEPVSIRFENCVSRMGKPGMSPADFTDRSMQGWAGMSVGAVRDDGPKGLVEFINCTSENTGKQGAKIFDKSADGVKVRFVNCKWKDSWVSLHRDVAEPRVPVLIHLRRDSITKKPGGIEFVDCHIYEDRIGPSVQYEVDEGDHPLTDVSGTITVHNKYGAKSKLSPKPNHVDLKIIEADATEKE